MRIALLSHTAFPGGAELSMLALAVELRRRDISAELILLGKGAILERAEEAGVPFHVVRLGRGAATVRRNSALGAAPKAAYATLECAARLRTLLRRHDFALVHANSFKAGIIGTIAARSARVPIIWHLREIAEPPGTKRSEAHVLRLFARGANAVVANSAASAAPFKDLVTAVHTPGLDLDRLRAVPPAPIERPDRLAVLAPGRLQWTKGQHVLIEAVRMIDECKRPSIVIAGTAADGNRSYEQHLRERAQGLRCAFSGHVDDLHQLLAESHLVVHSALVPESFGKVVVEAIAAGRPVLASRAGAPMDILAGELGEGLVAPGDPAALARAITAVHQEWPSRARLAERMRVHADEFDVSRAASAAISLYRRMTSS